MCAIDGVDSVVFESQFDLGLIRIEPDPYQSFCVDQFSNYINVTLQYFMKKEDSKLK